MSLGCSMTTNQSGVRLLHTMVPIADPAASRAFYEALGMEFRREGEIVRDGELEATHYFFGFPGRGRRSSS